MYTFSAKLWVYKGYAAWHFVTVPKKIGVAIKGETKGLKRGWGSVPVIVTIGKTEFKTSIFPDKVSGSYFLPVKASVRKSEDIEEGDMLTIVLALR